MEQPTAKQVLDRLRDVHFAVASFEELATKPGSYERALAKALYSYVRKEAVLSAQIEGTQSSLDTPVLAVSRGGVSRWDRDGTGSD